MKSGNRVLRALPGGVLLLGLALAGQAFRSASVDAPCAATARSLEPAPRTLDGQGPVFVENKGQWDGRARFLLRSGGLDMWVTDRGAVYDLYRVEAEAPGGGAPAPAAARTALVDPKCDALKATRRTGHVVGMSFLGTSDAPRAVGTEKQSGSRNYFVGADPASWATDVSAFDGANVEGLYEGIDAVFYVDGGRPRWDLVVAPGADPAAVSMRFEGATDVTVALDGSLVIGTSVGELRQQGLYAYQGSGTERRRVDCGFEKRSDGTVGFATGGYDRTRSLVIDPLVYSTYLGGTGSEQSVYNTRIAVDGSGNAYVAGATTSTNFPTYGAYQSSFGGGSEDAYVTKFNSDGSLGYATYLGGSEFDYAVGIAVDGDGNVHVSGIVNSIDFPTVNAYQSSHGGGAQDAFVAKLNSNGSALSYCTYLGGHGEEGYAQCALDGSGNVYVTGYTTSPNFPGVDADAFQPEHSADTYDVFVAELDADGTDLVYATYLGGTDLEYPYGIAVDGSGNAYVTGFTRSTDFPTSGAIQSSHAGGVNDGFVTKVNSGGDSVGYSTYLGGSASDVGLSIAVDGSGNAYVAGNTESSDFPTANAFQSSFGGGVSDGFVAKLDGDGSALVYSTYLGAGSEDDAFGIAVDSSGSAWVGGYTSSSGFPTVDAYQAAIGGGYDVFVTRFNDDGSALLWSTFLGGSGGDLGRGIAVDGAGNAYVTGYTLSTDFPTSNAAQSSNAGGYDAFVAKLDACTSTLTVSLSATELWPANDGMHSIDVTASADCTCGDATWVLTSVTGDDGTVAGDISAATGTAPSSVSLRAKRTGGGSGRTYTLLFTLTCGDEETTETCTVSVPHDQSRN